VEILIWERCLEFGRVFFFVKYLQSSVRNFSGWVFASLALEVQS
jgi:hypothetical protein